jgi:hypothetical protein
MSLFGVLSIPFRGERNSMHQIANVCAQLTNMDLQYRPLRKKSPKGLCDQYQDMAIQSLANVVYTMYSG